MQVVDSNHTLQSMSGDRGVGGERADTQQVHYKDADAAPTDGAADQLAIMQAQVRYLPPPQETNLHQRIFPRGDKEMRFGSM